MTPDKLKAILADHALWLHDEGGKRADLQEADLQEADLQWAFLRGANLRWADLRGADLQGANLQGADLQEAVLQGVNLCGATGNMREVKSAQFDTWPITWTRSPDGVTTLQIGCQRHDLELWRKSDPRWIAAMNEDATGWWAQYRDVVLALVDASPAVPWGNKENKT